MEEREPVEEERTKLLAEAERIKIDTEKLAVEVELAKADLSNRRIEHERLLNEARKVSAEADKAEAEVKVIRIETESREKAYNEALAANKYNHVYRFSDEVNEATVDHCMERLNIWHRCDPNCDIEVIFNSEGGSAIYGMELFDYLRELSASGHKIITGARGLAASMASILLQAGDYRWMGRNATLMIHQPAGRVSGKTDDMQDQLEWLEGLQQSVLKIYAERCATAGKNGTASEPLDEAAIKAGWKRKDWFLNSELSKKYGFVDDVRG